MASQNERNTEKLVRSHFDADLFPGLIIDEQKTDDRRINTALSRASKAGDGIGKPEFIVHSPSLPNLVILIECKAQTKFHESAHGDRPKDYAVDGVLHYAHHVSTVRDVVAIAVSGEDPAKLKISTFLHLKGARTASVLQDPHGPIKRLVPIESLVNAVQFDPAKRDASLRDLLAFSRQLHDKMRKEAKLINQEKALVVSAILIGLSDKTFALSYGALGPDEIGDRLLEAVLRGLERAAMPHAKVSRMIQPYSFIAGHPWLNAIPKGQSVTPLQAYCADLADEVVPYMNTYGDEDVVGRFFGEFLRYSGDQRSLGIVLTPKHITDLFCDLADLSVNDTVIDPCAGTGGFLISAMTKMSSLATTDEKRQVIRERQLVGIESSTQMFALAASNMLFRGDGKSNLYDGNSLDPAEQKLVAGATRHAVPTVGMVNPPYAQEGDGFHELDFVEVMLNMLAPGSVGIAIVPMSCGTEASPQKSSLMEHHTLIAAMSMPDQLFYNASNVVTCVLVFRAHHPHADSNTETWFGYWKDDGFKITRIYGRADADLRWGAIRKAWVKDFKSRSVGAGRDVLRKVGANDEWCAEAYLETDYSVVDEAAVAQAARRYAIYMASSQLALDTESGIE